LAIAATRSETEPVQEPDDRGGSAVMRYLVAATLARGADAGTAVGFVLLAGATPRLGRPALIGSLLVACLTAPHLFGEVEVEDAVAGGPVLARRLDRARDGRQLIALVCVATASWWRARLSGSVPGCCC
jgi:hypothetical protein